MLDGGNFWQGFASGALGSMGAAAFGGIVGKDFANKALGQIAFGALSGAIGAEATGGEWWRGAIIGGMVAGLNHAMHDGMEGRHPDERRTEGKGNKLRGGSKKKRDGDMHRLLKEKPDGKRFKEWYENGSNKSSYKLPGQPDPDIFGVYDNWVGLGRPKFSPVTIGIGTTLGASIIHYGYKALQLIGNRVRVPILIIPQLIPQQNNPYNNNWQ